jgi:hypothetical protein
LKLNKQKNYFIALTSGCLISSISVYLVLSHLLIPAKFTFPLAAVMAMISFGLIRYYSITHSKEANSKQKNGESQVSSINGIINRSETNNERYSTIIFTLIYLILLLICFFFSNSNLDTIYSNWNSFEMIDIITLGAGILVSFFMPGYAIVHLLVKKQIINPLLKVLIAYLCSILVTGLTTYISAIFFEGDIFQNKIILIAVNLVILIVFGTYYRIFRTIPSINTNSCRRFYIGVFDTGKKFLKLIKQYNSELFVFGSLFALLIISTYYLYGGITIGDQWYQQGRAILFMSGHFKEVVISNGDNIYSPLQSALLSGLTTLSGTPLVNTYASIAFLNMTAVLAFYYFCSVWFSPDKKRAALLASSLFVLGSGFGWIYILSSTASGSIIPQISSIAALLDDSVMAPDIKLSANFMIAAFPDFSTGLIYIALPAGFVLLGLVRTRFNNKLSFTAILSIVSILGILFHEEFYLFIIVSSLLPLTFNIREKNSLYLAFLFALVVAYIIDSLLPVQYFTSREISGVPLINLNIFFVLIVWGLYAIQQNLRKYFYPFSIFWARVKKHPTNYTSRFNFVPKVIVVWIVVYLCALSFVVWAQLPRNYIDVQTDQLTTPWYLYSMRLGLIGLLGVASILSYLYKKFEKEVFVFGIIIIVALLAGQYYNEHRLSKYIMIGMIGFSSLIIYKILTYTTNKKPILNGIILGSIVVSASLSTLIFIGYNAIAIQNHDYTYALGRRNFPSIQEMNMLDLMRSKILSDPNSNNVASFSEEYQPFEGSIINKLTSFSGLSFGQTAKTSLILNSSSLNELFHLLDDTNTKYIIIPNKDIKVQTLTDTVRFVLENFPKIYNDGKYIVLRVPYLQERVMVPENKVAIVYNNNDISPLSAVSEKKELAYNDDTFDFEKNKMKFINIHNENQTQKVTLYANKANGAKTLWSKNLDNNGSINYIEDRFKILGDDKTAKDSAGIKWIEGNNTYTVQLSKKGLQLMQKSTNDHKKSLLFQNRETEKNDEMWYSLKVVILENSTNVYVNDLLKIKVPRIVSNNSQQGISKVGINSENNVVMFDVVKIGKIPFSEEFYDNKSKYTYYYPLSSLALSTRGYGIFADDDYSVLSKDNIIIPFDPVAWNDTQFTKYLNYARSGGTLIVMNSNDNFNGVFSKLFSIDSKSNKTESFSSIVRHDTQQPFLNVSGRIKSFEIPPSPDVKVIASYRNMNNNVIAPFAIEKHFPGTGRIILINDKWYFDSINSNPGKNFLSLPKLPLIYLRPDNSQVSMKVQDTNAMIGGVKAVGKIAINGSSFSIINDSLSTSNVEASDILIFDKYGNLKNQIKNPVGVNIRLLGPYKVHINSSGNLSLPQMNSQFDNIGMSIPNDFNMTVRLLPSKNSHATIVANETGQLKTIEVQNESRIEFSKIRSPSHSIHTVPVLMKSPEIEVTGNISFKRTNIHAEPIDRYAPLDFSGQLKAKFDIVNHYNEHSRNGIKSDYITYLQSVSIDGKIKRDIELKIPGDISKNAKTQGLYIPFIKIFNSSSNILILIIFTSITLIVSQLLWRKKHV